MDDLYTRHADLYSMIADDRDFRAELTLMGALQLPRQATFVELFAGPAYHATELRRAMPQLKIVAIDNSAPMESVARNRGYSGTYICSDCVAGLEGVRNADIICVPRFSVALVDDAYLAKLFEAVSDRLHAEHGLFFVEVHKDPGALMSQETWDNLSIRKRRVANDNEQIECLWPAAIRVVESQSMIVEMDVEVTRSRGASSEQLKFTSREQLRTRACIVDLAASLGLCERADLAFETNDGLFLAFSVEEPFDPVGDEFPGEGSVRFGTRAFRGPFSLATLEQRASHLERSGFELSAHDGPLSLHVYNLL